VKKEKKKKKTPQEKEKDNLLLVENQSNAIESNDYHSNGEIHELLDELVVVIHRKVKFDHEDMPLAEDCFLNDEESSEDNVEDFNELNRSIFFCLNEKRAEDKRKSSKSEKFQEWERYIEHIEDDEELQFEKKKRKRNK
jgi:hypothetical protein